MTASSDSRNKSAPRRSNGTVVLACLAFVGGMAGMSYAAVPLYRMFCAVTGYNGTTQRAEQPTGIVLDRRIKVSFDANVSSGLDWDFKPMQRAVDPRIGETAEIRFLAVNRSQEPVTGQAVFNVTPMEAAAYFNKIECFCFTEQTLQPGETVEMPVTFFVDPDIAKDRNLDPVRDITLSYTFYAVPSEGS